MERKCWREVNDLNDNHPTACVAGNVSSGLVIAGEGGNTAVETWDGTNFTETTELNTSRGKAIGFGASSTDGLIAGGFSPSTYHKNTELWDGTSWTEVNDMNTYHQSGGSGGTSSGFGLGFGGDSQIPPGATRTANTESWNGTS